MKSTACWSGSSSRSHPRLLRRGGVRPQGGRSPAQGARSFRAQHAPSADSARRIQSSRGCFVSLPGSGDAVTSVTARVKSDLLEDILQSYFHDNSSYAGSDIALNDAKQAIKYTRSKKLVATPGRYARTRYTNTPANTAADEASQPSSPATTQHSLRGGSLLPYPTGLSPAGPRQLRLAHR